jgi:hypothetical protein
MTWLYLVLIQSVFVFVGSTLAMAVHRASQTTPVSGGGGGGGRQYRRQWRRLYSAGSVGGSGSGRGSGGGGGSGGGKRCGGGGGVGVGGGWSRLLDPPYRRATTVGLHTLNPVDP